MTDDKKDAGFIISLDDFKKGKLSKDLKTGGEIEEMRIKAKKVLDRILEILKEENFLLDISAAMIQIGPDIYKAVSVVKLIPK